MQISEVLDFTFVVLVYVRKDKQGKAELVLLDHGLYEYMEATERIALANMFKAIVLKDEEAMRLHAHTMNVDGTCRAGLYNVLK